jgi:subtilase family serine protease
MSTVSAGPSDVIRHRREKGEAHVRENRIFLVFVGALAAVALTAVGAAAGSGQVSAAGNFDYRVTPHWVNAGSSVNAFTNPFCSSHTLVCYSPADIKTAYDYPSGLTGAGQTIVIVDAFGSPTIETDLATFDAQFGLPAPPSFKIVCPLGCPSASDVNQRHGVIDWRFETTLDVEWAHAMAPGANIVLAVSPTSSGNTMNSVQAAVIAAYPGSIMSLSFGIPEEFVHGNNAQIVQAEKNYAAARAAGITVLSSAGDFGATNGGGACSLPPVPAGCGSTENAGYPSSSPNVTAVGGTQGHPYFNGLDPSGTAPPSCALNVPCTVGLATVQCSSPTLCPTIGYGGEETWNEPFFGVATGGAESLLFAAPSYQAGDGSGKSARTTPDVSYDAAISGGVLVFVSFPGAASGFYIVGGTSAGSPQMAAIVALANQAHGGSLGFLNNKLYSIAENASKYASDFHDITIGNNQLVGTPFGYSAGTGYDIATGWGTPDVANLVADLAS